MDDLNREGSRRRSTLRGARGGSARGRSRAARRLSLAVALVLGGALVPSATALAAGPSGAPVSTGAPTVSGTARDGSSLSANDGSWEGAKPISYGNQWLRCDSGGASCSAISGATARSYKAVHLDVGHTLRVRVTASNSEGEAGAESSPTATVTVLAPSRGKLPRLAGSPQDGQLLRAGPGVWRGTTPLTYSYKWEACALQSCSLIAGATEPSYRAATAQIGLQLRAIVTASNSAGSASAVSKPSKKIVAGPPVQTAAPLISGIPIDGQTLSATTGGWAGTSPFAYAYQWRSCSLVTAECSNIAGATAPTYTVGPLDIANSLEVVVKASNLLGSAVATSAPTSLIGALLPNNTALPSITGLLQDGGLLSALTGGWSGTGPLSFAYQWQICNSAGEACKDIGGASAAALSLLSTDVGSTVRVLVTATNAAGSTSATSEPTSIVGALLPAITSLPSIAGLLQDGGLLSAAVGSWSGTGPLSYSYQWQQCNAAGESCKDVGGAAAPVLSLLSGQVGSTLRVVVTATNAAGSTSATSEPTSIVGALLPAVTSLPSIAGSLIDGQSLSSTTGAWTGTGPISYGYRWKQCNAAGESCKEISGASASVLSLISGEVGSTMRVVVTATNSAGSTLATSAPTGLVSALLPSNTTAPSVAGVLQTGQLLTALTGTWAGTPSITYSYQWQLCSLLGTGCANIAKATNPSFLLGLLDVGLTLRVGVVATNAAGSSTQVFSPVTGLIAGLGLSPVGGPASGGTSVTISGAGVNRATAVHFGSTEAGEVEVKSPTEITAQVPSGSGTVPVTVTVPEGTTAANPEDQYTYR